MQHKKVQGSSRLKISIFVLLLIATAPYIPAEPSSIALYEEGTREQLKENYYRAVELYKESLSGNPSYVKPMIGLAECYHALGQNDEALIYVVKAQRFDRNNLYLINLEGNIRTELGELNEARKLFESVLKMEPHNLDAKFGLARLDLADGRKQQAAALYEEALKSSPENIRALLSLALLYEELGESQRAVVYLEQALKFHSDDPLVYLTAGRYFYRTGDYESATEHLQTALDLKPDYYEVKLLLGTIRLSQKKLSESISTLKEVLSSQRPDQLHMARYALGVAYGKTGMVEEALASFTAALGLKPEDEVARIAAENLTLKYPEETAARRAEFAQFHLEEGRRFEQMNRLDKALVEYRWSLILNPESAEARLAYANIYRMMGYPIKYLMELLLLKNHYQSRDTRVLDDIELYQSHLDESVSKKWADKLKPFRNREEVFDQFAIAKSSHSLSLAALQGKSRIIHPGAAEQFSLSEKDLLLRYDTFVLKENELEPESFDIIFRTARESGADFFLVLGYIESERTFQVDGELYLARTGSLLKRYSVFRTGNNRIREALLRLSTQIRESFPLKGALLAREFDRGVVNLGAFQQIKKGDTFNIIKKGKLRYKSDTIGFSYDGEDVLGSFVVDRTDESLSEGIIKPVSFFDRINPGDELVLKPSD
jgi:tetratricopeptide (TPR) repeat protein